MGTAFSIKPRTVLYLIAALTLIALIVWGLLALLYQEASEKYQFDANNPTLPKPETQLEDEQWQQIERYVDRSLNAIRVQGRGRGDADAFSELMDLYIYEPYLQLGTNVQMQLNAEIGSRLRGFGSIRFASLFYERALEGALATQPTHYNYIDSISKGTTEKTGFIAQEVKAVVPEAVTDNQKRFIPDVYALANEVSYDETSGQLAVRLPNAHPLLAGDSIKCITPEGEATAIVSAVGDDNTLMLDNWAGGTPADELESLFVFGKWVRDFHTVDYDHLYTLGISAIQALQQQLADVKAEQSVMKAELKAERQHNADQEARLKHIERMMGERAER